MTIELPTLSSEQVNSAGMLLAMMRSVYRFKGDPTIEPESNSVAQHVDGLKKLIDELVPRHMSKLSETLRMMAIFHDLGEILGEINTLSDHLVSQGSRDMKIVMENAIAYWAIKSNVSKGDGMIPDVESYRILAQKKGHLAVIEELANEEPVDIPGAKELLEMYDISIDESTKEWKLFKCLDILEGLEYYLKNATNLDKVPKDLPDKYTAYTEFHINEMVKAWPIELVDIISTVSSRLMIGCMKYKDEVSKA